MNCYFAGVNGKAMFGVRQVGSLDDVINDDDDDDDAISDDDDDDGSIDGDCDGHDGSNGGVDDDDDDDDTDRQTGRQKRETFLQVQDAGFHKAVHAITYQNMINNYKNCRYTKLKKDLISALETEISHRYRKNSGGNCASVIVGRKFHISAPR